MQLKKTVLLFVLMLIFIPINHLLAAGGDVDPNFSPSANDRVFAIEVQDDGKILVGGNFSSISNTNIVLQSRLSRLNVDGSIDTGFNIGGAANSFVGSIIQQPDGKLLVAGGFSQFNGAATESITRLNLDGSRDTSFINLGRRTNSAVRTMALQTNGEILLGGGFTELNGYLYTRLARLTSTAANSSLVLPAVNHTVQAIALQADGKILVGGSFSNFNNGSLGRLLPSGITDSSFTASPNGTIFSILVQDDGKILIGGQFTQVSGVARNGVARLNSDGSLDTSFNPDVNDIVYVITQQENGDILIGGSFNEVGGVTRNSIARLKENGTLDMTFDPDANGNVRAIAIEESGDIIVGGAFTMIGGLVRNRLARIDGPSNDSELCVPIKASNGAIAAVCL